MSAVKIIYKPLVLSTIIKYKSGDPFQIGELPLGIQCHKCKKAMSPIEKYMLFGCMVTNPGNEKKTCVKVTVVCYGCAKDISKYFFNIREEE